ncbi:MULTISPECIES: response regulator [unclassified Duganella]|uniref:response regulator n=1 Tax=unclassified Duganella TaxID=2636909 RepID=UPI00131498B7|nr:MULTISPECIES: response regulator [unclassified Duganella]
MPDDRMQTQRVLVVDDNHTAAGTVAALLEACGYSTAIAYGAEDALTLADQFRPDVIFLDIDMPNMDRFRTAAALRSQQTGDRARIFSVGFDAHLAKPASFEALLSVML